MHGPSDHEETQQAREAEKPQKEQLEGKSKVSVALRSSLLMMSENPSSAGPG